MQQQKQPHDDKLQFLLRCISVHHQIEYYFRSFSLLLFFAFCHHFIVALDNNGEFEHCASDDIKRDCSHFGANLILNFFAREKWIF